MMAMAGRYGVRGGLAAALVMGAVAGVAQDSAPLTLKVKVNEVVLPVTVRDKAGKIVSTLKKEDFVLTQDGRPQVIKSFAQDAGAPFRLGLLVDTSRSQQSALEAEKTASGKFVDQVLAKPGDKAFLLHFDRDVELLQDFTASKDKLHKELNEMTTGAGPGPGSAGTNSPDDDGGRDADGRRKRRGGGTQLYDAVYLAANELMLKEPGRKAIVVLSDGVDRGSKDSMSDAVDAAEKANLSVYTVYFKGDQERRESPMNMGRGGGMGGGYPGGGRRYPGGGYPGGGQQRLPETPDSRPDGKKVLQQIAARTGGRFFEAKKKDSFEEVYAQISEELKGQYLLTYSPDKPASKDDSDGFHKVVLKAKDESLTVITREGYYAQN